MNSITLIRRTTFQATQAEFAVIAGVGQATVSRWEAGESHPTLENIRRIRMAAKDRGKELDLEMFVAGPITTTCTADGTWIAYDPQSRVSASGPTLCDAVAELRRLSTPPEAA